MAAAGNEGEEPACGQNPVFNPLRPRRPPRLARSVAPSSRPPGSPTTYSPSARCPRTASRCRRASPDRGSASRRPACEVMGLSSVNGAPINALPARDPGKAIPLSGTSFATAYTSGVAALVRAKYPQLSAHQIIRRITETAHNPPRGVDNKVGYGVVDPVAALTFDVPPGDRLPPRASDHVAACADTAAAPGSAAAAHRADRCRGRGRARGGGRSGRGGSTEAVMKARTVGVKATIPAVIAVEVAVLAAIVIFPPARMSWWPTAATAVVAIAAADGYGVPAQRHSVARRPCPLVAPTSPHRLPGRGRRHPARRRRCTACGSPTDSTAKRSR